MKTMTCTQLGGACDKEFHADTFSDIATLSQEHGREMYEQGDAAHIKAMEKMSELMRDPNAMQAWMKQKQQEFDTLEPDIESR